MPKNRIIKFYRLRIIFFGLETGLKSFIRGDFKIGLKRLILPINYWRVSVLSLVINFLIESKFFSKKNLKILDIASPKLLSLFLSTHFDLNMIATDLQDNTIFTEWKKYYQNLSGKDNLIFEYANAKALSYPDKCFDLVYSISVIHMITPADNGDILALKEIQKKIKKDGLLIIEVPYRKEYKENFVKRNNFEEQYCGAPLFKERQYDDSAIENRIKKNIKGELVNKIILYEKIPLDYIWNKLPKLATKIFSFFEPWVDILNISVAKNKKQMEKGKSIILIFQIKE